MLLCLRGGGGEEIEARVVFVVLFCLRRDIGGGLETESRVLFVELFCSRRDRGGARNDKETENWFL